MKCCLSSSGCKTRPAKGEPARPVASLATVADMPAAMRRQANVRAVGLRPRNVCFPDAERSGIPRRHQWPSAQGGRGEGRIRRGVRPQHVRRGWPRNLGGPHLSSKKTPVLRRADDPSPTHGTLADARVVGLTRQRRSVRHEGGQRKGNRSGGRWRKGVGGLHTSNDVGEQGRPWTRPSTGGPCRGDLLEGPMSNALTLIDMSPGLQKVVGRRSHEPHRRRSRMVEIS